MATLKKTKYNISEIDWDNLTSIANIHIPFQVTVDVVDITDPEATPTTATVDVVTSLMMRDFLVEHYDWWFLSPIIGQGDWATLRFADMWEDFVAYKTAGVTRAVTAMCAEYNPVFSYYRHEDGTTDKITYNGTRVNNSGAASSSSSRNGQKGSPTVGGEDEDGYRAISPELNGSNGTTPETTTSVTTYDSETFANQTKVESKGDSMSISGSTQSAKETHTGDDEHTRNLVISGSNPALKSVVDVIQTEVQFRLNTDVGRLLLDEFANRYLWMASEEV